MSEDSAGLQPARGLLVLFALTVLVSAFLLFQVQPLISKIILPWFGGSPSVWTTAMLFFQCTLCAGYFYAHLLARRVRPERQAWVHGALLAMAAALSFFVVPDATFKPTGDEDPVSRILLLLAVSVGLPYFCLATTGPLIQYWFARSSPGASAFRLYALSNAGSFLALLSFPYLFEPHFEIGQLGALWTAGFWLFAVLCGAVVWRVRAAKPLVAMRSATPSVPSATLSAVPGLGQRASWLALPALASLAFIATTDHVSHDVAPEPRLWIATLSLYLLTFIVCFDHPRWYRRGPAAAVTLLAIALLSGRHDIPEWLGFEVSYGLTETRWAHFATLFLICFVCHGELYRRRPDNPRFITEFYLLMSVGGACGGLFVALIATHFFADYYEWSLALVGAIGLGSAILWEVFAPPGRSPATGLLAATAVVVLAGLVIYWEDPLGLRRDDEPEYRSQRVHQARNFYGTVSVIERRYRAHPADDRRTFYSGQIIHGMQFLDPARKRLGVTYYSPGSGAGETLTYAMEKRSGLRVAIVGLGAGTLANYARETDRYDFFDINPEVFRVADRWFDNLAACRAREKRNVLGDARLKFEGLPADVRYDVIVLDAFSGDSVPVHLLTREAFALYRQHLAPSGFIVVHITNSYLNLFPVVRRQAEALGLAWRHKYQTEDMDHQIRRNHYFVMTEDRDYLARYPSVRRPIFDDQDRVIGEVDPDIPGFPLWTDSFSSVNAIELKD